MERFLMWLGEEGSGSLSFSLHPSSVSSTENKVMDWRQVAREPSEERWEGCLQRVGGCAVVIGVP